MFVDQAAANRARLRARAAGRCTLDGLCRSFATIPSFLAISLEPSRPVSGDARISSPGRDKFPRRILLVLLLLWRCLSGVSKVTGEGGIRTLGSLLGYGALAKRCFRPLGHLTKSKAGISQAILDFQFVICIRGHRFRRPLATSSQLPIADCYLK